jgi:hypothetical protein
MAGFLGKAPLTSDVGLLLEIIVLALLIFGRFRFAGKGKIRKHAFSVLTAVILHITSILLIMVPSFEVYLSATGVSGLFSPASIITWIHVPMGTIAIAMGIYLILNWRLRQTFTACYKRKSLMRPLWWLWVLTLTLGMLIYVSIAFS